MNFYIPNLLTLAFKLLYLSSEKLPKCAQAIAGLTVDDAMGYDTNEFEVRTLERSK